MFTVIIESGRSKDTDGGVEVRCKDVNLQLASVWVGKGGKAGRENKGGERRSSESQSELSGSVCGASESASHHSFLPPSHSSFLSQLTFPPGASPTPIFLIHLSTGKV